MLHHVKIQELLIYVWSDPQDVLIMYLYLYVVCLTTDDTYYNILYNQKMIFL